MGNLQSAARLDCQPLNCENGANKVRSDPLPELLYCKITFWSTYPAPFWKFDSTKMHPVSQQNTKWGGRSATTWLQPCVIMKQHNWPK